MATLQKNTYQSSIITVSYEDDDLTLNFLTNLDTDPSIEIIVVDNSSTDSLRQKIATSFNYVTYIHTNKNIGYGGAVNMGIKQAQGEWIMILNNDIETSITKVQELIQYAVSNNVLLATPKLVLPDGTIQHSIGYFDSFSKHAVNFLFARPRFIDPSTITDMTLVNVTTGAAMLIHKSVIEQIGMFDDNNFFMYFEDIDLCLRMYKHKLSWLYVPQVAIKHLQSVTANKNKKQKKGNYYKSVHKYLLKHRGIFASTFAHIIPTY